MHIRLYIKILLMAVFCCTFALRHAVAFAHEENKLLSKKCGCPAPQQSVADEYNSSNIVAIGKVEDLISLSGYEYLAKILIDKTFKFPQSHEWLHTTKMTPYTFENHEYITSIREVFGKMKEEIGETKCAKMHKDIETHLTKRDVGDKHYTYLYYSTLPGSCNAGGFDVGQLYLIYASHNQSNNTLSASACGRTTPLSLNSDKQLSTVYKLSQGCVEK